MTCRELADFIADYLANELSPVVRAEFERHLSACENCRRYLGSYEAAVLMAGRAFEDGDGEVPAEVPEELVQAVLGARRR